MANLAAGEIHPLCSTLCFVNFASRDEPREGSTGTDTPSLCWDIDTGVWLFEISCHNERNECSTACRVKCEPAVTFCSD
jgi:hypothetical protein